MQVKLIKKNQEKTKYYFLVKGAEPYMLNAIRRSVISMVPTMAIENVEIRKNTSILYDEVLAHRIGLIPLKTDLKSYEMIEKPEDVESLKCSTKLTLKMKGPKVIYSGDFKPADPAVAPVFENMPIVTLNKGQQMELEATAILGIGKDHTKWSPGIVHYKHKPIINIKGKIDVDKLKENIPENSAFKISGDKVTIDEDKLYTTNYADSFIGESIIEGVDVSASEDEFVLITESFGQLSVKEMLTASLDKITEKLNELESKISKL